MQCPSCSSQLSSGEIRCSTCGSAVSRTDVSTVAEPLAIYAVRPLDFPPGTLFAERFTIIEKAGQGGMGVVYKAIDTSLDQVVALKLIRPELAQAKEFSDRFRQEVRLTRQVSHPNVCRVHDLGESKGLLFLSMEWVDGQTLRQLLDQAGPLEQERALEISEDIARALGAAHTRGIVHRDLKPSNVMIDRRGATHVMDFGIAVGLGPPPGPGVPTASGTPAYMSPEQRRGERPDARSDLYALGLILLEMLMGPLSEAESQLPLQLPLLVRRRTGPLLESLLAAKAEERCASAEVAFGWLRQVRGVSAGLSVPKWALGLPGRRRRAWILASAALLLVAALAAYRWNRRTDARVSPRLPESSSQAQAYYDTALHYLQGEEAETVRSLDDAIHMLHRAVDQDPNFALAWARLGEAYWIRYGWTREASSREEATRAVEKAFQLDPNMPETQYARGRGLIAEGKYKEAREVLEKVVQRKPDLDIAWANLGTARRELGDYPNGLRALQTAIKLNPTNFRYQVNLGHFYYHFGEYDRAASAYRQALRLKPLSFVAWEGLGTADLQMGRPREAAEAFVESNKLEEHGSGFSNLGTAYYFLGNYEDAAGSYRRATELEPKSADHWGNLGDALRMLDKIQEAHAAYLQAVRNARDNVDLMPQDPRAHLMLGLYCARARDEACALSEGNQAAGLQPESSEALFRNAVIHCIFGKTDEALDWLEKAVRLGLTRAQIRNDPDLVPLHSLVRYQKILELAS